MVCAFVRLFERAAVRVRACVRAYGCPVRSGQKNLSAKRYMTWFRENRYARYDRRAIQAIGSNIVFLLILVKYNDRITHQFHLPCNCDVYPNKINKLGNSGGAPRSRSQCCDSDNPNKITKNSVRTTHTHTHTLFENVCEIARTRETEHKFVCYMVFVTVNRVSFAKMFVYNLALICVCINTG